jgi:hypothetical protein
VFKSFQLDVSHSRGKQFRERYKGYKIPFENLLSANSALVKQIAAAGTRIKAPRSQAHVSALSNLSLISLTDEETAILSKRRVLRRTKSAIAATKSKLSR